MHSEEPTKPTKIHQKQLIVKETQLQIRSLAGDDCAQVSKWCFSSGLRVVRVSLETLCIVTLSWLVEADITLSPDAISRSSFRSATSLGTCLREEPRYFSPTPHAIPFLSLGSAPWTIDCLFKCERSGSDAGRSKHPDPRYSAERFALYYPTQAIAEGERQPALDRPSRFAGRT